MTSRLMTVALSLVVVASSVPALAQAPGATGGMQRDHVVVVSPEARIMRGYDVLATVPGGAELEVLQVRGAWVGVNFDSADGQRVAGWIHSNQLRPAGDSAAQLGGRTYRSFSYEPEPAAPVVSSPGYTGGSRNFYQPEYERADSKIRGRFGR